MFRWRQSTRLEVSVIADSSPMPPDMVAVGSTVLGPNYSTNSQIADRNKLPLIPMWKPRSASGRGATFVLWEDGLHDVLPKLALRRDSVYELPPARPSGHTLCAESLVLYERAMEQYHHKGTELFDAVRPSLDLDGPYAAQDIRLIQRWKDEYGRKDGRSLVRWALSFTDRSSISGQMDLVTKMNALSLPSTASVFDLSEHLMNLWEYWLALSSSDRDAPASFFSQLVISVPTSPEGPLVKMRSWFVDLVEEGVSPLLRDVDGAGGLLARLVKYATSHGLPEVQPPPALNAFNPGGAPPGGGGQDGQGRSGQAAVQRMPCVRVQASRWQVHLQAQLDFRPHHDYTPHHTGEQTICCSIFKV